MMISRFPLLTASASLLAGASSLLVTPALADNPIVQHVYTADPAPMVHDDTVYLCTSHDEDVTVGGFFTMNDWFVFSSKDMVNWTDHGSPLSYETFSWATGKAWAPQCIARGGKYYFYVPVSDSIGVAVADSPIGPFKDALGKPLVSNYQYIDPTVHIDDDGQAYLYFGNPKLWYVKLNDDMISFSGQVQAVPMTTQSFGQRNGGDSNHTTLYEEGPWFYKRNDLYYMMFASGGIPEDISYSTSTGPTGPWSYGGVIMENQAGHAFTNHAGVIDYKGSSFFFYHTQELPGGGGYKRSTAVEKFTYNADGTFPTINKTSGGVVDSVDPLIPYSRVEGETMAWGEGIEVEDCSEGGRNVANIENGDYIKVESVDFLTGATSFEATVASAGSGGTIDLHLDTVDGALVGTCTVAPTGGWQEWEMVSCDVTGAVDVHDLFLVFKGAGSFLFNLDWWQFVPKDPLPEGTGGMSSTGGADGSGGLAGTGGVAAGTGGDADPNFPTGGGTAATGGSVAAGGSGGALVPGGSAESGDAAGCSTVTSPRSGNTPWSLVLLGAAIALLRFVPAWRRRRNG